MIKYRIGILGTENSHADGFLELINKPDENGNMRYPDCKVTILYGNYRDASEKLANEYGIEIAKSVEDMVGKVDAVMVTARDGKYHNEFAKPFLEAGIPAFIDKPFTVDIGEAKELIAIAKENNVPICGGSSLKFSDTVEEFKELLKNTDKKIFGGTVSAPLQIESEYSGFYFYASHLTEMTLEIFGYNPKSVIASRNSNNVCAIIEYDGFTVTNHFNNECYSYAVSVYLEHETHQKIVDTSMMSKKECDEFIDMIHNGKMTRSYEEYIVPVRVMNAIVKSFETGEKINLK